MKILIIGGVAGGATAATRLRRLSEENEVIIFEKGEHISFANCGLPYHIGGVIADRDKLLLQTPTSLKTRYNLDVRIFNEVLKINKDQKTVEIRNLITKEIYTESYDKLLLSPGAEPFRPNIPGINLDKIMTLRNVADMDRIIVKTKKLKNIAVVGGGFIGLEVAENLVDIGLNVSVIELGNQVMAPVDFEFAKMVQHHAAAKNLKIHVNTGVEAFEEKEDKIELKLNNGQTMLADAVIFAIGVKPENALAKAAGLELGVTGGIAVNEFMQTSDAAIYAVGDAIEVAHYINQAKVLIPLAWPANRQGRLVADTITRGNKTAYKGTLGTSILKFFDLTVATTGLNEKLLKRYNIPYRTVTVTRANHASYYPGATNIVLKMNFGEDGTIYGAQALGQEGVDKRIDVIATAIKGNLTIYDLQEIEVAYAPPYNAAKDPVNILGYVAENMLNDDVRLVNYDELDEYLAAENGILIDVRTKTEFENGAIPNAIHMDVDTLRENLDFFDKNKKYVIYCQIGLRGYLAQRILRNNDIDSVNLNGGYGLWKPVNS
ncbi:MAG TPA: FAD-dependent oxidoreductase [Flavobacterium sp.]|uniref:FAD-dependent oxidoreductase n=1 Tax=Flavobacterium sp. TaxID=239 RepID=UPI001B4172AE|nr:FAD-dependent oxidoreductase [Flavobacterium sp.]MBP7183367.1 FAD-dependent oxidoreductase [Flavobacterium sp.]MBP7319225.1 FAD-dependent oxidoreductase [Flavobacterium sp.]HRL71952.1 FAD-dependent oxidoreductase [Flavobacterium sp.]HRM46138.1 FAD-dependent oxidoreductase [Flavobacterium sp.]